MTYHPPKNLNVPFKAIVVKKDPNWEREKRNELEYQFSNGRQFYANPNLRGAYAPPEED